MDLASAHGYGLGLVLSLGLDLSLGLNLSLIKNGCICSVALCDLFYSFHIFMYGLPSIQTHKHFRYAVKKKTSYRVTLSLKVGGGGHEKPLLSISFEIVTK